MQPISISNWTVARACYLIALALQMQRPTILWSKGGRGKSSTVHAIGRKLGVPVEVLFAPWKEPTDLAGLPDTSDGYTVLCPPKWAYDIKDKRAIIFVDDISSASPVIQEACLQLVWDRWMGDLHLPKAMIIAAANPAEETAIGVELNSRLANRFVHIDFPLDPDYMIAGFERGFEELDVPIIEDPSKVDASEEKAKIAAYWRVFPDAIEVEPRNIREAQGAFPTPRTWESAAILWAAYNACEGDDGILLSHLFSGCVGSEQATNFLAWLEDPSLPRASDVLADPSVLLQGPNKLISDDRLSRIIKAMMARVSAADTEVWLQAWGVLDLLATHGKIDIGTLAARQLILMAPADVEPPPSAMQYNRAMLATS